MLLGQQVTVKQVKIFPQTHYEVEVSNPNIISKQVQFKLLVDDAVKDDIVFTAQPGINTVSGNWYGVTSGQHKVCAEVI